jgi:hypothetical protein
MAKGLYLQVMPNGSRYWRMKYRFDGKEKLASFAVYPEVSLADARKACLAARQLLAAGTDPSEQKKEVKRAGPRSRFLVRSGRPRMVRVAES